MKDLLRRKELNKPYRGGVNSYVLAMMVYGIVRGREMEGNRVKDKTENKAEGEFALRKRRDYLEGLRGNLYLVFCEIANYLKTFVPFETLINPFEHDIPIQPDIHLNIVDPFNKKHVKTSAFRIN